MQTTQKTILRTSLFLLSITISHFAYASSTGITGYSGNPAAGGGNTCVSCHSGGVAPTVELTGPTTVQPGTVNSYTLTITGGQANSGGLDVSVSAGTLINTQSSTKLQNSEITHTARANAVGGAVSWTFNWQAPATGGTYTIYSSGLSTNGNGSTTGDAVTSITTPITVSAAAPQSPTAIIDAPVTAEINQTIVFDGSASYDPDGVINSYVWDFGDGNTATGAVTNNTYTAAGTYTVTLTVTDDTSRSDTTFVDITVGGLQIPNADAGGPYTGNINEPVTFDASASTHTSTIVNYIWDFGDGTPYVQSASPIVTHTYVQAGSYTVTLAAQDANNIPGIATAIVTISGPPPALDGAALYTNNCAGCHGPLATSAKLNRTAAQIQAAIDTNAGNVMGSLSGLTVDEVQAIADALVSTGGGGGGGGTLDGATLYTNNCSGCHGPLATSSKLNRTAAQIQAAIDGNAGNVMGSLSGLTAAEVQAIADALVSTGGGGGGGGTLDGATLYTNNCSGCHGPLATSSKQNRTAAQIQSAINNNAGGVMGSLSGLTTAEVQAIADALATGGGGGTPTTGEELYNAYCLVCHGPEGRGGPYENIRGQTASSIASAINQVSLMNSLSSLTSSQIEAIAGYLSGATTSPTVTGQDLYNTYCLACHGPGGTGGPYEGITGASTSQISGALSSVNLMSSINLNSTQIRAISDYLNGNGGSTGGGGTTTPTDGATLYTNYCSGCHGPLATSSKLNRTAQQIQSAINNNTGGMGTFASILSSADVQAIADALATGGGGGTGGGTTLDGAALYTNNCSGCHGQLATSSKLNRTATQIQNAITNNAGGVMGSINLTTAEIQAIADALASTNGGGGTTSTGESLYVSMCQGCHGVNGTGGSAKAIVGASANNILSAISSVGAMSGLSLTSTQAQDISTFLSSGGGTTTEPTSGADLYALKCQACHGAGGYGGTEEAIRGASLSQIRSAMQTVSAMQPIPLTDSQAQAIANYLNGMSYNSGSEGGGGYTGGGD